MPKIIEFCHLSLFLGLSEKYYKLQSLWIALYMAKHYLRPHIPSSGTSMAQEGSKTWLFLGQNRRILACVLWGDDPTWKLFHEPYHISLHARHYVGPFMTFQDTCMVQKGSKIWLFLCQIEHGHHMNKDPLAFFRGILSLWP